MANEFWNFVPAWIKVLDTLQGGTPFILHAPRHYGKRMGFSAVAAHYLKTVNEPHAIVQFDVPTAAGCVDYGAAWRSFCSQTKSLNKVNGKDKYSFKRSVARAIGSREGKTVIVISTTGGLGIEPCAFEFVSVIHEIHQELFVPKKASLQVVILDDYSLYHYENLRKERLSGWDLSRIHYRPLTAQQVTALLQGASHGDPNVAESAAEWWRLTGGHPGLLQELLFASIAARRQADLVFSASDLVEGSSIIEGLRLALEEDPLGLTEVALRFEQAQVPSDIRNPSLQFLRQLGVVHWLSSSRVTLCPGVISELVRGLNRLSKRGKPLGSLASELGPRVYDSRTEDVIATDDDIVVVHLSDLHVSEKFPFRLNTAVSGRREEDKYSAAELLTADLSRLGLIGRIDAMVVSGDFTGSAQIHEFKRAREILEEVCSSLGVDRGRLLIVAGNHDVEWKPSTMARLESLSGVSRENYETFRELLGLDPKRMVEALVVPSRTGKSALRLVGLDSNLVEGPEQAGMGFVGSDSFSTAEQLLKGSDVPSGIELMTWLTFHHHVYPATSLSMKEIIGKRSSMLGNAVDVLAFANRIGAEAVLHGHEHQPSVTVARWWPADAGPDFRPIVSVGAGSFSGSRDVLGPFSRNQYFVLYRQPERLVIRSRTMGDAGLAFAAHHDLLVPMARMRPSGLLT